MQVSPILPISSSSFNFHCSMCSPKEIAEISANFSEDFSGKLKFDVSGSENAERLVEEESFHEDCIIHDDDKQQLQHEHDDASTEDEEGEDSESDDDEEFEFSFVSTDHDGSPISAEDIFSNGEIRPIFPLFNRDLLFAGGHDGESKASSNASSLRPPLRKVFVEERDVPSTSTLSSSGKSDGEERPVGEYCVWRRKAVEASPEVCKKSNSTGFSRLWRFRDLLHRSSSDGKDAFVFLDNSSTKCSKTNQRDENVVKIVKVERRNVPTEQRKNASEVKTAERKISGAGGKVNAKAGKGKTAMSAHEKHYARNRATKEGARRRSYLPYRQDLVGFFTNVNGLSRNVHPF